MTRPSQNATQTGSARLNHVCVRIRMTRPSQNATQTGWAPSGSAGREGSHLLRGVDAEQAEGVGERAGGQIGEGEAAGAQRLVGLEHRTVFVERR